MAYSARYKLFDKRIRWLRKTFLPKAFSSTGNYSDDQLDYARAFVLLAHCEMEAYLEDRASEVALHAYHLWEVYRLVTTSLLALVTFRGPERNPPTNMATPEHLDARVKESLNRYIASTRSNHGLKESDVLTLLYPIGILGSDIDPTWLSTLSSFCTLRGSTAHQTVAAQQTIDPWTQWQTVKQLVSGLKEMDLKLTRLIS